MSQVCNMKNVLVYALIIVILGVAGQSDHVGTDTVASAAEALYATIPEALDGISDDFYHNSSVETQSTAPSGGAGRVSEDASIKWKRKEVWLQLVPGTNGENYTDLNAISAAEQEVETVAVNFCETYELDHTQCEEVSQQIRENAHKSPIGDYRLAPAVVDRALHVEMSLRDPTNGETSQVLLHVEIDQNPIEATQKFCDERGISLESCESLANQTLQGWRLIREKSLRALQKRFEIGLNAANRLGDGSEMKWSDAILAQHHLSEVVQMNPSSWQAWYSLGNMYSLAASDSWLANIFQEKDSTIVMKKSLACFEESLSILNKNLVPDLDVARVTLLGFTGVMRFYADDVDLGRVRLKEAIEISRENFEAYERDFDDQSADENYGALRDLWRKKWQKHVKDLMTLEANVDNEFALDKLIEPESYISNLTEREKHALEMYRVLHFPFVLENSEDIDGRVHTAAFQRLERLLMKVRTSPDRIGDLDGYFGFYSVYSGALENSVQVREYRDKLGTLHRLSMPSLNYVSPHLQRLQASQEQGDMMDKNKKLRVGFISSFFYDHSVGKLLCGTISQLIDRDEFEVVVVSTGSMRHVAKRAGACYEMWGKLIRAENVQDVSYGLAKGAHLVFEDTPDGVLQGMGALADLELDVAIFGEVGLNFATYFLSFGRIAPVQAAFWGHPLTTGMGSFSMDYMITSRKFFANEGNVPMEKTADERLQLCASELHLWNTTWAPFSESLICTETLGTYFAKVPQPSDEDMTEAREILREALLQRNWTKSLEETNLYYLPHKLMKFHPRNDAHLRGIVERDPNAILVFSSGEDHANQNIFSVYTHGRRLLLNRMGIAPERTIWLPALPTPVFLAVSKISSAVLESFGSFGSGVTALEIFALGVPMVCMPNNQLVGPSCGGMYKQIAARSEDKDGVKSLEALTCLDEKLSVSSDGKISSCYIEAALRLADTSSGLRGRAGKMLKDSHMHLYEDEEAVQEWSDMLLALGSQARSFDFASSWSVPGFCTESQCSSGVQDEDVKSTDLKDKQRLDSLMTSSVWKKVSPPAPGPLPRLPKKNNTFIPHVVQLKDTFKNPAWQN
mmetsp:Transcript_6791/g.13603  ORF Transcript_6791/g.13603 Transcript_6791/m.13603 type:complete len:1082 (+) Transcript_6791:321-3566(+)